MSISKGYRIGFSFIFNGEFGVEIDEIKDLINTFEKTEVNKLLIKKGDFELHLEHKPPQDLPAVAPFPLTPPPLPSHMPQRTEIPQVIEKEAIQSPKEEDEASYVSSPMVGTIYMAPSPEDPPFVKPGDEIDENTVVCIIEAMKVMNEVKSGLAGVVKEALIENGHPVEFGSNIFRITKS